ncbi:hypothetical protein Acr_11g0011570 [Actinidia rufa]|uniref:Uncharacterized protein n=1 Tax=Actinidia rufa TaxID=165716 RepID=A0A7J0FDT7_9ERIC|nr:hypothetical protein Acr_11g0011570 [Actinidia rufa]
MAPKKDDSKAAQMKDGGSKSSATTNTGPGAQSSGPTTRSKAKAAAETLARTSLLPKSIPVFGLNLPKASTISSNILEGKGETAALGAKDTAAMLEEEFSKPSVPQRSALKFGHDDKEIEDSASYDFSSSSGTPRSKLNLSDISADTQKPKRLIPMSSRSEIQFGSIDPVDLASPAPATLPSINRGNDDNVTESGGLDDEGWTLVTRIRKRNSKSHHSQHVQSNCISAKPKARKQQRKRNATKVAFAKGFIYPKATHPYYLMGVLPKVNTSS